MTIPPQFAKWLHGKRLKKALSQNFLIDEPSLKAIAHAALPHPDEQPVVVEIGPGAGFLTQYLLPQASHLTAVEVDKDWVEVLTERFGTDERFSLVQQDVRQVSLAPLLDGGGGGRGELALSPDGAHSLPVDGGTG